MVLFGCCIPGDGFQVGLMAWTVLHQMAGMDAMAASVLSQRSRAKPDCGHVLFLALSRYPSSSIIPFLPVSQQRQKNTYYHFGGPTSPSRGRSQQPIPPLADDPKSPNAAANNCHWLTVRPSCWALPSAQKRTCSQSGLVELRRDKTDASMAPLATRPPVFIKNVLILAH